MEAREAGPGLEALAGNLEPRGRPGGSSRATLRATWFGFGVSLWDSPVRLNASLLGGATVTLDP